MATHPVSANPRSWIKPHFHNIASSADQLNCLIAEANLEDARIEMARPYPALVQRHIIVLRTDKTPANLEWTVSGRRRKAIFHAGDVIINPTGLTTFPQWDRKVKLGLLAIRPEALKQAAEQLDVNPNLELVPCYGFRDPLLAQLIQTIVDEFAEEQPDLVYAETMAQAAMVHLIRTATNRLPALRKMQGKLPAPLLQRVIDFARANLSSKLSLEQLASLAGFSPVHFARLFRESTGLPPHQWLLEQRVEKAEGLLRDRKVAISEVAARAGFADQSHLTRYFRRLRGTTPSRFRSQL